MSQSTIFDVDAPSDKLAFQGEHSGHAHLSSFTLTEGLTASPRCADFGSATISSDLPMGRISPSNSPNPRQAQSLYATGEGMSNSISGATQAGGFLSLDSCECAM